MKLSEVITLPTMGDERGFLVAVEGGKSIPFEIKRAYYVFGTKKGVGRGFHAHKQLRQLAVCVSGSCLMVFDDGHIREEVLLDSPTKGVLINKMVWHEMLDFSDDCVLMVLADEHYDEADYIREYDCFLRMMGE